MISSMLFALGGAIFYAAVRHVKSDAPPIVDPKNQRPLIDLIRDAVRAVLKEQQDQQPPVKPA